MTSEILKVKKCFGYPPDLEETPLVTIGNSKTAKMHKSNNFGKF
jgi:hypothetical protein